MPLSWLLENLRPIASNNPSRKLGSLGGMLKYTSVETYSVLQASCLQHWFKNWQALRRNKLTASTFAAAIGFIVKKNKKVGRVFSLGIFGSQLLTFTMKASYGLVW